MKIKFKLLLIFFLILISLNIEAKNIKIYLLKKDGSYQLNKKDKSRLIIGNIILQDKEYGLLIGPDLSYLMPGVHTMAIHENHSCDLGIKNGEIIPALKAGLKYNPLKNNNDLNTYYKRYYLKSITHSLYVDKYGNANLTFIVPGIKYKDIKNRSLLVKVKGSSSPEGVAIACGIID